MYDEVLNAHIGICSYRRAHRVPLMREQLGERVFQIATWYVRNEEEAEVYRAAGAPNIRVSTLRDDGGPGDLVHKRNLIMDDAFANNHNALVLSDDLVGVKQVIEDPTATGGKGGGLRLEPVTFEQGVRYCYEMWDYYPSYYLVGTPPTNNLFYIHHNVSTNLFAIGDFWLIKPNPLRCDERIRLKHDYDLSARHLKQYGGLCRVDFMIFEYEHYKGSNAGGCDIRTYEVEDLDIAFLMANHPGMFRLHDTREHEVKTKFIATMPSIETFKDKPHYVAFAEYNGTSPGILKGAKTLEERITRKQQLCAYYSDRAKKLQEQLDTANGELEKHRADLVKLIEQSRNVQAQMASSPELARRMASHLPQPPQFNQNWRGKCFPEQRQDFDPDDPLNRAGGPYDDQISPAEAPKEYVAPVPAVSILPDGNGGVMATNLSSPRPPATPLPPLPDNLGTNVGTNPFAELTPA